MNYMLFFLCTSLTVFAAQAMNEDAEKSYRKKVITTYLQECNRKNLQKEGLCPSVSGNGVTISAKSAGGITKLTLTVKKAADTSNNPEFGRESSVSDSSFVMLRRDMRDDKHLKGAGKGRIICQSTLYYPYAETPQRFQRAQDEECRLYVPNETLFKKNNTREK